MQTLGYFMLKSDLPNSDKIKSVWDIAVLLSGCYSSLLILSSSSRTWCPFTLTRFTTLPLPTSSVKPNQYPLFDDSPWGDGWTWLSAEVAGSPTAPVPMEQTQSQVCRLQLNMIFNSYTILLLFSFFHCSLLRRQHVNVTIWCVLICWPVWC